MWQGNLKKFEKLSKTVYWRRKCSYFLNNLMKFDEIFGKNVSLIILKVTKNHGFSLFLKKIHIWKSHRWGLNWNCITYLGKFLYSENWAYNFLISSKRLFEFHCSPLNFRYRACFEQWDTLHSSNDGVYIHSKPYVTWQKHKINAKYR